MEEGGGEREEGFENDELFGEKNKKLFTHVQAWLAITSAQFLQYLLLNWAMFRLICFKKALSPLSPSHGFSAKPQDRSWVRGKSSCPSGCKCAAAFALRIRCPQVHFPLHRIT